MQVTFVSPHFDASEAKDRQMFIDKNTRLSAFSFSTPFTKSGGAFGSVTEQFKRNTVIFVKSPFPHVTTAQTVIKRSETILDPIESACEDVDERTHRCVLACARTRARGRSVFLTSFLFLSLAV